MLEWQLLKYRLYMLVRLYKRLRGSYRRLMRLLFMSPAEARFVELMGGKVLRLKAITHRHTGFPLTIVLSLGKILKDERMKREVRYGKYFVDFANDLDRIIEIDGQAYHMDIVADFDREVYIREYCQSRKRSAQICRIPAVSLRLEPNKVQRQVMHFLYK